MIIKFKFLSRELGIFKIAKPFITRSRHLWAFDDYFSVHFSYFIYNSFLQGIDKILRLIIFFWIFWHSWDGIKAKYFNEFLIAASSGEHEVFSHCLFIFYVCIDSYFVVIDLYGVNLPVKVVSDEIHGKVIAIISFSNDFSHLLNLPGLIDIVEIKKMSENPCQPIGTTLMFSTSNWPSSDLKLNDIVR